MKVFGYKISKYEPVHETFFEVTSGKRQTVSTVPTLGRVSFDKLENCYITEPIEYAGINLYVQCIAETWPSITSSDDRVTKGIKDILNTRFPYLFSDIVPRHIGIFGNSWVEYIYNTPKTKIVNFTSPDPKTMNFIKDPSTFKIKFDDIGLPVGYIQQQEIEEKEFTRDKMVHIAMNQINRGQMGIGFIEPVYQDIVLKENIEQAKSEWAYRSAFAVPYVRYGNEMHMPDDGMKQKSDILGKALADEKTTYITYPFYTECGYITPPPMAQNLEIDLDYHTKLQAAVFGIPLAVLQMTSKKEDAGGVLEQLVEFFSFSLKAFQRTLKIADVIGYVLFMNKEFYGIKKQEEIEFKLEWSELSEKSKKEKIMETFRYGKAGLLGKDKTLMNECRKRVNLPPLPDSYDSKKDKVVQEYRIVEED